MRGTVLFTAESSGSLEYLPQLTNRVKAKIAAAAQKAGLQGTQPTWYSGRRAFVCENGQLPMYETKGSLGSHGIVCDTLSLVRAQPLVYDLKICVLKGFIANMSVMCRS